LFQNTTIAVVGKGQPFKLIDDNDVQPYLERIGDQPRTSAPAEAEGGENMQE
jgi:hypothetical protein